MNTYEFAAALAAALSAPLPWDNDLVAVCAEPARQIKKVLCALDASPRAVAYACSGSFDALLTHHPLLFDVPRRIAAGDPVSDAVILLIRAGVSAISLHTRLDLSPCGINAELGRLIGMEGAFPFGEEEILLVGNIAECSPEEFGARCSAATGAPVRLYPGSRRISRVAVCCGSGNDQISIALESGAHAIFSGDLKYHPSRSASDAGLTVCDGGHYFTERSAPRLLNELVIRTCPYVETEIFDEPELGGRIILP
ncbi:MAG: Nif3-like dinuclear metal center hexameric protein [Oscillospiraceae bacterium]|nr:Nif3-like dinuclear metal center hexameric protein [Oscillospiraceae bacterium]